MSSLIRYISLIVVETVLSLFFIGWFITAVIPTQVLITSLQVIVGILIVYTLKVYAVGRGEYLTESLSGLYDLDHDE